MPQLPSIELLEHRTLLAAAPIGLKIPVLTYHRGEVLEEARGNASGNSDGYFLRLQMKDLWHRGFDSITIDQYLSIRNGGQLPPNVDQPFIAIFDDATTDQLADARHALGLYNYVGVTAIPTGKVGSTEVEVINGVPTTNRLFMNWNEIETLVDTYHWDVASHSVSHNYMGVGPGAKNAGLSRYKNTESDLQDELGKSMNDPILGINNHVKTVRAFVHPYDDVTTRTLSTAESMGYEIAFGKGSFYDNDTAQQLNSAPQFAASTGPVTDLVNGQLRRISITTYTTRDDFLDMLDLAIASKNENSQQYRPTAVTLPNVYIARDGTVMVGGAMNNNGTGKNDTVEVLTTSVRVNAVTFSEQTLRSGSNYIFIPGTQDDRPFVTRFNIATGDGDDIVIVTSAPAGASSAANATIVYGGRGNDELRGSALRDYLYGGSGSDIVDGKGGIDTLLGGSGADAFFAGNDSNAADIVDYAASQGDSYGSQDGFEQPY